MGEDSDAGAVDKRGQILLDDAVFNNSADVVDLMTEHDAETCMPGGFGKKLTGFKSSMTC